MKKAVDSSYAIWKWLAEAPVKWSDEEEEQGWTSWKEKKAIDRAGMLRRKSERLASRGKEDKAMECLDGARGELFQLSILQKEEVEEQRLEKCSGTCKDWNLYYKGRLGYEFDVLGEEVDKPKKVQAPMWNYTCGSGWFHMEDVVSNAEWDYYYKR
jgi:uncharacterized membrane protein YkoI